MPSNGYGKEPTIMRESMESEINHDFGIRGNIKREFLRFSIPNWFETRFIKRIIYKRSNGYWLPHLVTGTDPNFIKYVVEVENQIQKARLKETLGIVENIPETTEFLEKSENQDTTETSEVTEAKEEGNNFEPNEDESADDEGMSISIKTEDENDNQKYPPDTEQMLQNTYEYTTVTPFFGNIGCCIKSGRKCVVCGNGIRRINLQNDNGGRLLHFNYFEGLCEKCAQFLRETSNNCKQLIAALPYDKDHWQDICNLCSNFKKCREKHVILIGVLGMCEDSDTIRILNLIVEREHGMDALRRLGSLFYIMIRVWDDEFCNHIEHSTYFHMRTMLNRIFPEFQDFKELRSPIYSSINIHNGDKPLNILPTYFVDQYAIEVVNLLEFLEYGKNLVGSNNLDRDNRIWNKTNWNMVNWNKINNILGGLLGYIYTRIQHQKMNIFQMSHYENEIDISCGNLLEDYWIPNIEYMRQAKISKLAVPTEIDKIERDVTDGDITDGDITDGDITDEDITDEDITDRDITDYDIIGSIGPMLFISKRSKDITIEILPLEYFSGGNIT